MFSVLVLKTLDLFGEIVLAGAFTADIGRAAVQTAAESAYRTKGNRNDFKPEFVIQLHLFVFLSIHADGLGIEHERIHGQPLAAE